MVILGLCFLLGLLVVFVVIGVYEVGVVPTVPVVVPTPTVTAVEPTVTVTQPAPNMVFISDAFDQTGVATVLVTDPAHIPEVGTWTLFAAVPTTFQVTPGDGYCVPEPAVDDTYAVSAMTGYDQTTDTVEFSVAFTVPSNLVGTSASYSLGAFLADLNTMSDAIVIFYEYIDSSTSTQVIIQQLLGGVGSLVNMFTGGAPTPDAEQTLLVRIQPDGKVSVTLNDVEVVQGTATAVPSVMNMTSAIMYLDQQHPGGPGTDRSMQLNSCTISGIPGAPKIVHNPSVARFWDGNPMPVFRPAIIPMFA